jgi:hypothetical protein
VSKLVHLSKVDPHYAMFWCPGCDSPHGLSTSTAGEGPHWQWNEDADRPTLTPSLLSNPGREVPQLHLCHSFITDGRIQFLGDCTHALAGQTVDLPEWDEA